MNDLVLDEQQGVAHYTGKDRARYDDAYYAKVCGYDDAIEASVNGGRCAMIMRHLPDGASVLDIGAGAGAFIRAARSWGFDARGYDVMSSANERLKAEGIYSEPARGYNFDAITLWDVIEHLETPDTLIGALMRGTFVFISTPIFSDLHRIEESKHYRPGEHLHYWTEGGLILYMEKLDYRVLETSDHEAKSGRDSIGAFVFIKD